MSKTVKIILWIVVVVIVVGGIWWWMASRSGGPVSENYTAPTSTAAGAASSTASSTQTAYPQGNSDQAINQDMTSLNAQMNGLSSDNASVTQSMNDQPVQQVQ